MDRNRPWQLLPFIAAVRPRHYQSRWNDSPEGVSAPTMAQVSIYIARRSYSRARAFRAVWTICGRPELAIGRQYRRRSETLGQTFSLRAKLSWDPSRK